MGHDCRTGDAAARKIRGVEVKKGLQKDWKKGDASSILQTWVHDAGVERDWDRERKRDLQWCPMASVDGRCRRGVRHGREGRVRRDRGGELGEKMWVKIGRGDVGFVVGKIRHDEKGLARRDRGGRDGGERDGRGNEDDGRLRDEDEGEGGDGGEDDGREGLVAVAKVRDDATYDGDDGCCDGDDGDCYGDDGGDERRGRTWWKEKRKRRGVVKWENAHV